MFLPPHWPAKSNVTSKKTGEVDMAISQAQRDKYAIFSDGSYPIFNKKTAISALRMRGMAKPKLSKSDRAYLIKIAAKYATVQAAKARARDKEAGKI
jgi:hypothetical protein